MLYIRKGGHRDLEKYYTLMEMDFDSEELLTKLQIHRGMMNGSWELQIISDDETKMDLAYALVGSKNIYGYVLLKYFAVLPWYRGQGIGIQSMRLLNKLYADKQGIIAELTQFEDEDPNHLKKLIKFFSRFGYEEVESDYKISGTKANLYVKPIKGTADIKGVAHRIIPDFYSRCMNEYSMDNYIDIKRMI